MSMVMSAATVMRRAYAGNTNFKDDNYRKNSTRHDVMSADQKAMVRALDRLEKLNFESTEEGDTKSIYNTVTSYLDIYNNAVSSARDSDSTDIQRTGKAMKAFMKKYSSELEAMGIQLKSDGTVKIDKNELQTATTRQVSKIFGNSDYISGMDQLMRKLRNQVNREVPRQDPLTDQVKSTLPESETVGTNLNLYG